MAKVYQTADFQHVASPIFFLKKSSSDNFVPYIDAALTIKMTDRQLANMFLNNGKAIYVVDEEYGDCYSGTLVFAYDASDQVTLPYVTFGDSVKHGIVNFEREVEGRFITPYIVAKEQGALK